MPSFRVVMEGVRHSLFVLLAPLLMVLALPWLLWTIWSIMLKRPKREGVLSSYLGPCAFCGAVSIPDYDICPECFSYFDARYDSPYDPYSESLDGQ